MLSLAFFLLALWLVYRAVRRIKRVLFGPWGRHRHPRHGHRRGRVWIVRER